MKQQKILSALCKVIKLNESEEFQFTAEMFENDANGLTFIGFGNLKMTLILRSFFVFNFMRA